ncbi:hypothetical protein BS50DRAFT_117183 [Corynespora cassiicola Philippines]|uniref:Tyrosine-protein phosphatase 2 n=1 Tax=Corynespora cassiicola Philippines TaxID=1448308 RepID=A0A2T2NAH1_CORCC|nr:hypothetical protein BS50DRAFT_117183 [Corynespora cassiicola Philippines]
MASAPLQVPVSPSSSKRSRSRDSTRSTAASSLNASAFHTPAGGSTPSLLIPSAHASLSASPQDPSSQDPTPYPAFLRLSRTDIHDRFVDLEWQQRQRILAGVQQPDQPPDPFARCNGDDFVARNRYANVDPYQNNRVRLAVPDGHNDYINASPIRLATTRSATDMLYIATQGPKPETSAHMWRMVWDQTQSPAVVIMLTKTHEQGREKCFAYYPRSLDSPELRANAHDEFEDGQIHNLRLESLTHDDEARTEVRELDMANDDGTESKKVWHLLFTNWPDFFVPEGSDRAALLKLIELSRAKNADNATNPRIVHCSAGVGRTGSFIALDWLLQELDEGALDQLPEGDDPIVSVVDNLRKQRMMMVQGEAQFTFLYDVIRDCWRERWISQYPEEAEKLGVHRDEPKVKRQKSGPASDAGDHLIADEDSRAELEAELMDAEADFEKGKT